MSPDDNRSDFGRTMPPGHEPGQTGAQPSRPGVSVKPAEDPLIGTLLADRYQIISVVGEGGMGVVYKARHELIDRLVAIKMLRSQFISDDMSVKRFHHEAKAASRLNHPNVITLYDYGVAPSGEPYIVMEFLQGISLADAIDRGRQLPLERAAGIFSQVCDALFHAHGQGMIHRDMKPGNIMLLDQTGQNQTQSDYVKVVDFGIAKLILGKPTESQKLTQTGEIFGSPVYMSPEQCAGQELDARSDIYSLGIVMYEALTGRVPFLGANIVETITMHLSTPPQPFVQARPDLAIPENVEAVVMRCLRKDQSLRYASMEELKYDLQNACGFAPGISGGAARQTGETAMPRPRPTGDMTMPRPRPTSEFRQGQSRASGEYPQPADSADLSAGQSRGSAEFRRAQSRPSGEYRRTQARQTGTRSISGMDQNWSEPAVGPEQAAQSPLVLILSVVVALLVGISGAIIWAASTGMFASRDRPAQGTPAPPPGTAVSGTSLPTRVEPRVPANRPIKIPTRPSSAITTTPAAAFRRAAQDRPRRRPPAVTSDNVSTPALSNTSPPPAARRQPVETPTVDETYLPARRHRIDGDAHGDWLRVREIERGQR